MAPLNRVPNEQSLQTTLVGTQVFRDTPVAPTYKWYGTTSFTENRPITESDEYAGTWFADYAPTYGPNEIGGSYAEDLTYEDVAILPRYGVKGGVTGVDDTNTVHGYLYTYTTTPSRDDLDVATIQHGFPGMPKQAEMVVFDQFTISADADNAKAVWQWTGNLWARKRDLITTVNDVATGGSTTTLIKAAAGWTVNAYQGCYVFIRSGAAIGNAIEIASNDATTLTFVGALPVAVANTNQFEISGRFTPGITDRTREKIAAPGTTVTIDDYPGGTIGTTQAPKWISWSVTYMNNLSGKRFGPDIDVYSSKLGRGKVKVTGQIRLEFDDPIEYEKYKAKTQRRLRFEQTGTTINTSPLTKKRARIDLPNVAWSQVTEDVRGTNITATYAFVGYVDITLGYPYLISSLVPMSTLP
jgi:hypothetical protein